MFPLDNMNVFLKTVFRPRSNEKTQRPTTATAKKTMAANDYLGLLRANSNDDTGPSSYEPSSSRGGGSNTSRRQGVQQRAPRSENLLFSDDDDDGGGGAGDATDKTNASRGGIYDLLADTRNRGNSDNKTLGIPTGTTAADGVGDAADWLSKRRETSPSLTAMATKTIAPAGKQRQCDRWFCVHFQSGCPDLMFLPRPLAPSTRLIIIDVYYLIFQKKRCLLGSEKLHSKKTRRLRLLQVSLNLLLYAQSFRPKNRRQPRVSKTPRRKKQLKKNRLPQSYHYSGEKTVSNRLYWNWFKNWPKKNKTSSKRHWR